ncbi:hypothetical protein [Streptomyces sp. FH025]|uniref:hypothetical protein n=1 Tax=Streptomyces sp. FH025 TaxID=2815937 RepID=UPI0035AE39C4
MARQAGADRERRARIITADGEFQAAAKPAEAAAGADRRELTPSPAGPGARAGPAVGHRSAL